MRDPQLSISADFKAVIPTVAVGWITATIRVSDHEPALWEEIGAAAARFRGETMEEVRRRPVIKALRDAYRKLGNDPTRYRGAAEALIRRIVQGKELYRVNTVVDINNLLSLETFYSAGVFDWQHIEPPLVFRIGQPGESYAGIGRGEIQLAGLPVFADARGPCGCTTSDSERAMVRSTTTEILLVVISFLGSDQVSAAVARVVELLTRYASAREIATGLVS